MSGMVQQFPELDDILPADQPQPSEGSATATLPWKMPVELLATGIIAPVLVAAVTLGFVVVLTDFALFRLRHIRNGRPQPKGMWEF
jgi:hypothetical protein